MCTFYWQKVLYS